MKYHTSLTMRDISLSLRLPLTTVQRALSGHPYVNSEVRAKIIQYAKQHNYVWRGHRKSVVFIIGSFLFQNYLGQMLHHLERCFSAAGYSVEIIHKNDLSRLHEHLVAGAVSLNFYAGLEKHWTNEQSIPMVALNSISKNSDNIISVNSDERQGIFCMMEKLYHLGHRKIAFIACCEAEETPVIKKRRLAFEEYYRGHRLLRACKTFRHGSDISLHESIEEPLVRGFTAFVAAGEGVGESLLEELLRRGYRVPEDISVIGLLMNPERLACYPKLSGVAQNYEKLASTTLTVLEKQMHGSGAEHNAVIPYLEMDGESIAPQFDQS